ncbi:MAG: hypothetical protein JW925_13090 [Syntrophaceae bacterium]|nr:hypothetical protein [Syntrophaceae bacterium]
MQKKSYAYINPSTLPAVRDGSLKGKTFILQPNLSVADWPTEAGSLALDKYCALEDATVIERLKRAGAHIVGSMRMSELGFGLSGDHTGEALTKGDADFAIMTDMMGEARIVASFIGFYGFKPTYGIVSRFGLIGLVPSMECLSVLADDPAMIAEIMGVIAGADDRDYSMDEKAPPAFKTSDNDDASLNTVGIVMECINILDEEDKALFQKSLDRLKTAGLSVKEFSLHDFGLFRTVHHCVGSVEASSCCGKYDGVRYGHRNAQAKNWNDMYIRSRAESFSPLIKAYLFQGAYFQFKNYAAFEQAARIRSLLVEEVQELFAQCDALAFPTRYSNAAHPSEAGTVARVYDEMTLTLPANTLGMPAIQVPDFTSDEVVNPGLQIMGPRFSDNILLTLASRLFRLAKGGR